MSEHRKDFAFLDDDDEDLEFKPLMLNHKSTKVAEANKQSTPKVLPLAASIDAGMSCTTACDEEEKERGNAVQLHQSMTA